MKEEVVVGGENVSFFFFFKQKTAYEIYQCDWSSDVCSSDLCCNNMTGIRIIISFILPAALRNRGVRCYTAAICGDRKSVV